jgi:adenylate kinase family enzyme
MGALIVSPLTYMWNIMFRLNFDPNGDMVIPNKIVVLGVAGGGYKTTLANDISDKYGHTHIKLDKCFYKENWVRHTPEQIKQNIYDEIDKADKSNGMYIVEGLYTDKANENFLEEIMDDIIQKSDTVVFLCIPKHISMWRKLFRSFKRAINVTEQGTCPEKLHNVISSLKKTWCHYDSRYKILNDMWEKQQDTDKFIRSDWPYYVSI